MQDRCRAEKGRASARRGAGDEVAFPDPGLEDRADPDKRFVAGGVSEAVVQRLQPVRVDDRDRK